MNAAQPQENWKTDEKKLRYPYSNYNINNTQGTNQVKYTTFITHNHGSQRFARERALNNRLLR